MSDCPTCLPISCGVVSDLDLYSLDGPLFPFVLNCPPGSNCNAGEIQVPCGDDFVTVNIPVGATDAEKRTLILEALAACEPRRRFNNPDSGDPNAQPPIPLYFSRAGSCTVFCSEVVTVVNGAPVVTRGGPFTYTFLAGAFIGATQEAADNIARALACIRAKQHRFCLSAIQKAFCVDEGFTATIKATGQYIAQFPNADFWEISAGLPPGLTFHGGFISGGKAVIDGTPTTAGLYTFTVKVTLGSLAAQGDYMEQVYTLAIVEIDTETPLPALVIGTPYTQNLTVIPTHDQETEQWSVVDGELPDGLELTKTGILHGTPEETGEFPFTAQVTAIVNGTSITCEKDFTFEELFPTLYYSFDALSGGSLNTLADSSLGKNLVLYGGSAGVTPAGAFHNSIEAGTGKYQTASDPVFDIGTDPFTIRFWFKVTASVGENGIFDFSSSNASITVGHNLVTPEDIRFAVVRSSPFGIFFVTSVGFLINVWHHVVLRCEPGNYMSVVVDDGVVVTANIPTLPSIDGQTALRFNPNLHSGFKMDELCMVIGQAWSAAQVTADYNSGAGRFWPF